jgi:hypothetical protein
VIDVVALGGVLSDEAASKLKDILTSSEIRKIGNLFEYILAQSRHFIDQINDSSQVSP